MYESFLIFEPNNDKTLPSKNKIDNYIIIDILDDENNIVFKDNKFKFKGECTLCARCSFHCPHPHVFSYLPFLFLS